MNVLRAIENIRKDVLNFEEMFIESDMPDCFSRIYESENPTVSARELHEKLNIKTAFKDWQYCYVWKKCGEILNLRKEIVFRVRNVAWNAY